MPWMRNRGSPSPSTEKADRMGVGISLVRIFFVHHVVAHRPVLLVDIDEHDVEGFGLAAARAADEAVDQLARDLLLLFGACGP